MRQADVGWFVVDLERTNEFGQELIHGPYGTLKTARAAIPEARSAKAPTAAARPKPAKAAKEEPPPPPPRRWIDDLKPAEAREVRRLIAALEREGIDDAEDLVRRDRDGLLPAIATRLIERRLEELAEEAPDDPRALLRRAAEALSSEGSKSRDPLPGWVLVEVPPGEDAPRHRRIDLRR